MDAGQRPGNTPKFASDDVEHRQFAPASVEEEYHNNLRSLLIRDCNTHKKTIDCHQLAGNTICQLLCCTTNPLQFSCFFVPLLRVLPIHRS